MGSMSSKQHTDQETPNTSRWSLSNLLAKLCCASVKVNDEDTYAYAPAPQEVEPSLPISSKDTNNNYQCHYSKLNYTEDRVLSGGRGASDTVFCNDGSASVDIDIKSFVKGQPPKTDDTTSVHNSLTPCSSDDKIISSSEDILYEFTGFRQKSTIGYMVNILTEQHGQLKIQTIRRVWPRFRNKYDRRYLYVTIRRLLEPRFYDKNLTKAKLNWHTRRQAALKERRQRCQEVRQQKEKLLELQLAGPDIPWCGQDQFGFRLISRVACRPVIDVTDGAPIILGIGRSGQVDLVYDKSGYLMAKKTVTMETQESSQIALLKEVQALQAVQEDETFPTLIGVIYEFPYTVSFLMEYVGDWYTYKSTTLWDQVVSSDSIEPNDWLMLIQDVGWGLKLLHSKGFIHCDLHSHNVLVYQPFNSRRPRAKIIDMGNATPRTGVISYLGELRSEEKEDIYNNYNHAAPEVVEGESFYTVQSDIYAYGRILNNVALYRGINELVPLSEACLCRNPIDRCSINHVLHEIDSILQYGSTCTSI